MDKLSPRQSVELSQVLITAFPTRSILDQLTRHALDVRLADIADSTALRDMAMSVVDEAMRRDKVAELLQSAVQLNPDNQELRKFGKLFIEGLASVATLVTPAQQTFRTEAAEYLARIKRAWRLVQLNRELGNQYPQDLDKRRIRGEAFTAFHAALQAAQQLIVPPEWSQVDEAWHKALQQYNHILVNPFGGQHYDTWYERGTGWAEEALHRVEEALQHKENTEASTREGLVRRRPRDTALQSVEVDRELLLEPEQRQLLTTLVAADRAIPRERREEFIIVSTFGGTTMQHPGLPNESVTVYEPDIEILAEQRLLKLRRGRGTLFVTITPQGFAYHERLQAPEHPAPPPAPGQITLSGQFSGPVMVGNQSQQHNQTYVYPAPAPLQPAIRQELIDILSALVQAERNPAVAPERRRKFEFYALDQGLIVQHPGFAAEQPRIELEDLRMLAQVGLIQLWVDTHVFYITPAGFASYDALSGDGQA